MWRYLRRVSGARDHAAVLVFRGDGIEAGTGMKFGRAEARHVEGSLLIGFKCIEHAHTGDHDSRLLVAEFDDRPTDGGGPNVYAEVVRDIPPGINALR